MAGEKERMMRICSIEGCNRKHSARGMCNTHYVAWRKRNGLQGRGVCSVDECGERALSRGLCNLHYLRFRRHGDPLMIGCGGRPTKGEHPTISAIHQRLKAQRGVATGFRCIDCGGTAAEWSYNNADPQELVGIDHGKEQAYSLDLANYDPRCKPCHRQFDRARRKQENN